MRVTRVRLLSMRTQNMAANQDHHMRIGDFLVANGIVTQTQLTEALDIQRYNPSRRVGEILVTTGALTKEDLIMAMEMFLMYTDDQPQYVDEWLDQEEVDMIQQRLTEKGS